MARVLSLLSSFLEANGLGGPDFWGYAILLLQALHLTINTYLETKFLWPMLIAFPPISSAHFAALCLSLYFVLLQLVALAFLLLHLLLASLLLPLIALHLLLIASILVQLIQLLSTGNPNTELFVWFWYLSACVTFTLYQAMIFSASRSPKLSASIAPAPSRARRIWIPPPAHQQYQQNQRRPTEDRPLVGEDV